MKPTDDEDLPMIVRKHEDFSASEIFYLLASAILLIGLNTFIYHQQYFLAGDILETALWVLNVAFSIFVILKIVNEVLFFVDRIRNMASGEFQASLKHPEERHR